MAAELQQEAACLREEPVLTDFVSDVIEQQTLQIVGYCDEWKAEVVAEGVVAVAAAWQPHQQKAEEAGHGMACLHTRLREP